MARAREKLGQRQRVLVGYQDCGGPGGPGRGFKDTGGVKERTASHYQEMGVSPPFPLLGCTGGLLCCCSASPLPQLFEVHHIEALTGVWPLQSSFLTNLTVPHIVSFRLSTMKSFIQDILTALCARPCLPRGCPGEQARAALAPGFRPAGQKGSEVR